MLILIYNREMAPLASYSVGAWYECFFNPVVKLHTLLTQSEAMTGCLRFDWNSVSPVLTSEMTSPVRHLHHHQQQHQDVLRGRNDDGGDDDRSLSTPPLPVTSDRQHFIKAEPMSPSAAQPCHVTSGQGYCQGQSECQRQGRRGEEEAVLPFCEGQGRGRNAEAAGLSGQRSSFQGYIQGHAPAETSSAAVLTSVLGDDASSTSPMSTFTAAASSSSSAVLETDPSVDTAAVVAKHARLEVNPCHTEWHSLD